MGRPNISEGRIMDPVWIDSPAAYLMFSRRLRVGSHQLGVSTRDFLGSANVGQRIQVEPTVCRMRGSVEEEVTSERASGAEGRGVLGVVPENVP